MSELVPVGSLPAVGEVPQKMYAQIIRQDRIGDPRTAFQVEEIDVPELKPYEVLIGVMAARINYNNIWAARGMPADMEESKVLFGNRVALVGAPEKGLGRKKAQRGAA